MIVALLDYFVVAALWFDCALLFVTGWFGCVLAVELLLVLVWFGYFCLICRLI